MGKNVEFSFQILHGSIKEWLFNITNSKKSSFGQNEINVNVR